jgi:hypothetical protein
LKHIAKAENQNYFRGPENCARVREWRARHPGYWRKKKPAPRDALQENCCAQVVRIARSFIARGQDILGMTPGAAFASSYETQAHSLPLRRVPRQFSWIDQRLIRDGHISRCGANALALYLLLCTVADAQGLSYYSDPRAASLLSLSECELRKARAELLSAALIAYRNPFYQVLSLEPHQGPMTQPPAPAHRPTALGGRHPAPDEARRTKS